MPNKDGTGPEGKGPKTGRQGGNCENSNPAQNRGFGKGMRYSCENKGFQGRGCRRENNA